MILSLPPQDYWNIVKACFTAIDKSLSNRSLSEPQLVANLVWHIPREVNALSLPPGTQLKSGSVFVHAQPFVKFDPRPKSNPGSVELGDLLLLRTEVVNKQVSDRQALLLQAKKTTRLSSSVASANQNQHFLYAHWPQFAYIRSGILNGQKRHVVGSDLCAASKYLLIDSGSSQDRQPPFCLPFWKMNNVGATTASATSSALHGYRCFLSELTDFIVGNAGKEFVDTVPQNDYGWSKVIEDLTKQTAVRMSNYIKKAGSTPDRKRGQGDVLFFQSVASLHSLLHNRLTELGVSMPANDSGDNANEPPMPPAERNVTVFGGAISIIEFVIEREEG